MQPVTTPRIFSGRYELTHVVARGGMAQVYRAHDRRLDRPVALKVLYPELSVDRAFVERFRREAQAAANLSHPNIVPVFDWGEDGGTYFIVMEFIDGQPLSQALRSGGPMTPQRVAQIGARVADALAYAHRHGVVHRDVKPGNVLLTGDDEVKVTDFGIARAINTEESLTQTGAVMGTATYFSPEQAEGHGVDARSDIYSLGVVLYEMVAARPPFLGETPVAVASKHVRETPPQLRDLNPTVPPALESVIAKAMAKSPSLRYQNATELQADLRRFVDGRPVSAPDAATTAMLSAQAATTGAVGPTGGPPPTGGLPPVGGPPVAGGPGPARSKAGRWLALLVALLVALGLILYFLLSSLGVFGTSSKFALPNVRGEPVQVATGKLEAQGLHVHIGSTRHSSLSKTRVIKTDPQAGATVKSGDTVSLVVSSGPVPLVTVPDVTTTTVSAAEATLSRVGLTYTVVLVKSTKPKGTVLKQTPPAGTKLKKNGKVVLTVATQTSVVVPNVVGLSTSQAANTLGAKNLSVGATTTQCSATIPAGQVAKQTPAATATEPLHSPVALTISTGPCAAVLPTVKGQTGTAAKSTLGAAGFTNVTSATTASCNPATDGKVVLQTPAAGKSVPVGNVVTLTVCSAAPPTTTTSTTTTTTTAPPSSTTTTGAHG